MIIPPKLGVAAILAPAHGMQLVAARHRSLADGEGVAVSWRGMEGGERRRRGAKKGMALCKVVGRTRA